MTLREAIQHVLRRCLETYDDSEAPVRGGKPVTIVQAAEEILFLTERNGDGPAD